MTRCYVVGFHMPVSYNTSRPPPEPAATSAWVSWGGGWFHHPYGDWYETPSHYPERL